MMPLSILRQYEQIYLASPYSLYKPSREAAAVEVARVAGELLLEEINTYSPIAHGHALAEACDALDPNDEQLWERSNERQMENSDALVIVLMHGWDLSSGIAREIDYFREAGKPIHKLDPHKMELR